MNRKSLIFTTILIILLMATSLSAMGKKEVTTYSQEDLFIPDITEERYAFDMVEEEAVSIVPGAVLPYNGDMVDIEHVAEDGSGIYVAVLDTGLLPSWPFFFSEANIAWELGIGFTHDVSWDDDLGDFVFGPLRDDRGFITELASGHGTHVASTVVGFNVNNSFWVSGIAPEATIIPVLVLDAWYVQDAPVDLQQISGGTDEMVSAGIYYVADLAETLDGPVVINMSLGGNTPSPMIEDAVDYAIEKGVIVVASAGNNGTDGLGYPGGYPQVINAAAGGWTEFWDYSWSADVPENLKLSDSYGNPFQIYLEDFSSRPNKDLGQKNQDLDVTTPGAWVVGPYKSAFAENTSYYYLGGTSMAAPHVSAIAALVLQGHPDLDQAEMESILRLAAAGLPLPAADALVSDAPYDPYWAIWDGGDAGKGFLQAPEAITVAGIKDK